MTTRRQMVLALSAAGLAGPPSGFAQQPGKVPRVGVLYLVSTSSATATAAIEALRAGLKELGYVEGRTVEIEFRSA